MRVWTKIELNKYVTKIKSHFIRREKKIRGRIFKTKEVTTEIIR